MKTIEVTVACLLVSIVVGCGAASVERPASAPVSDRHVDEAISSHVASVQPSMSGADCDVTLTARPRPSIPVAAPQPAPSTALRPQMATLSGSERPRLVELPSAQ